MTQVPSVDVLCYFVTADPPTIGHRGVVLYALSCVPTVKEVRVIPPLSHVWGKLAADFDHRFNMLRMTMANIDPRVRISSFENNATLSGYSVDTLAEFVRQEPGRRFGMVMGSDAIDTFHLWRSWEDILDLAVVYVCPRGAKSQTEHEQHLQGAVKAYVGSRIFFLPDTNSADYALHISSTDARTDIARDGETNKVSSDVMNYIQEHHLYGTQ